MTANRGLAKLSSAGGDGSFTDVRGHGFFRSAAQLVTSVR
jgi:hypothetical protein